MLGSKNFYCNLLTIKQLLTIGRLNNLDKNNIDIYVETVRSDLDSEFEDHRNKLF